MKKNEKRIFSSLPVATVIPPDGNIAKLVPEASVVQPNTFNSAKGHYPYTRKQKNIRKRF